MESRITFDTEAKAGYIYLLPDSETYTIQATEDVGDSPLLVDIDEHDRIVGIECLGEIAQRLSPIAGSEKYITKMVKPYPSGYLDKLLRNIIY